MDSCIYRSETFLWVDRIAGCKKKELTIKKRPIIGLFFIVKEAPLIEAHLLLQLSQLESYLAMDLLDQ